MRTFLEYIIHLFQKKILWRNSPSRLRGLTKYKKRKIIDVWRDEFLERGEEDK